MSNPNDEFSVSFSASIYSRTGGSGNLHLNSNSDTFEMNMADVADLLIEVRGFMLKMKERFGKVGEGE
jgi:hypothetical protein